jgi:hypothetical protein
LHFESNKNCILKFNTHVLVENFGRQNSKTFFPSSRITGDIWKLHGKFWQNRRPSSANVFFLLAAAERARERHSLVLFFSPRKTNGAVCTADQIPGHV